MNTKTLLSCLALILAACAPAATDRAADLRRSLIEADRAWSGTLDDAEAFMARLDPDVYFMPPDVPRIQGPEAFRSGIDQLLQMPGARLTWSPDVAEVSGSGDSGYTIGSFELVMDGPDQAPVSRHGKYATFWKRDPDGDWRVVVDTFNFDAPPPEASAAGADQAQP